jgi:hypothetical protein
MTAVCCPPPGQLRLWDPLPDHPAGPWEARDPDGTVYGPISHLALAAHVAGDLAAQSGDAWLVAADGTWCHVPADAPVTPATGWPVLVARVLEQRKDQSS